MKARAHFLAAACGLLLTSGCAGYTVLRQTDKNKDLDGIRFCRSAPYLLVSQATKADIDSGNGLVYKIIYLPDADQTYIIHPHGGLGSANVSATFTESGLLTQFGGVTDAKIPETLTAVGGLLAAAAGVAKAHAAGAGTTTDQPGLYRITISGAAVQLVRVAAQ